MDDSRLYDLLTDINLTGNQLANESGDHVTTNEIELLKVRAIAALAEQVNLFGDLIEELIEPGPSRWQRVKGWMHVRGRP